VTGALGLLVSYLVHPVTFLASLAYFVVYFIYSMPGVRLKDIFVVKELVSVSAFMFGSLIASTAITGGLHLPTIAVGAMLAGFGFLSTPAVNESFDSKEDQTSGIRTLSIALSWQGRVQMLGAGIFYIVAATLAAATWLGFSYILPIFVALGGIVVLMNLPGIYREFEDRKVMRMRRVMKVYLFFTQIMFVVAVTDFAHTLL
jgi:4-hydroxybenzoate polyprenyltransferase